jgi:hypothetical protein
LKIIFDPLETWIESPQCSGKEWLRLHTLVYLNIKPVLCNDYMCQSAFCHYNKTPELLQAFSQVKFPLHALFCFIFFLIIYICNNIILIIESFIIYLLHDMVGSTLFFYFKHFLAITSGLFIQNFRIDLPTTINICSYFYWDPTTFTNKLRSNRSWVFCGMIGN